MALGNLEEARTLMERSVTIAENNHGPLDPFLIDGYANLALIERYLNNFERAKALMLQVIRICEHNYDELHPSLAASYTKLALLEQALGNLEKARELMDKALPVLAKYDPVEFGISLCNLSQIELDLRRRDDAKEHGIDSFNVLKQVLPNDHPTMRHVINYLQENFPELFRKK